MRLPWHKRQSIVAGFVLSDGTVQFGTGFAVTRTAVGDYRINLLEGLKPIAASSNSANNPTVNVCASFDRVAGSFRVVVFDRATGAVADQQFSFIAVCQ